MKRQSRSHRWQQWLLVIGIVALAFNLRPAAVSVGPLLDEITTGLRMSPVSAGLLTSLPVVAFATVGALAPRLARIVGLHRVTLLSLACVTVGLAMRTRVDDSIAFLAWSFLALAGMATANVVMPSLVKLHFPHRIGSLTAIYTTAMAIGLTAASVITVPIAEHAGTPLDWRRGLAVWAVTALIAALPWFALIRHDRSIEPTTSTIGLWDVAKTRLGLMMALFFGLQSLQAYSLFGWVAQIYRDAGFSPHDAGLLLGVMTGVGIPLSFAIPVLAARSPNPAWLLSALMACYPVGLLGLMLAPDTLPWLWVIVLGAGLSTFPLILTLINLRARTTAGTAALSGFTQSAGYLVAALGPVSVGALYDATDGWTAPLLLLLVLSVAQLLSGLAVTRPAYIEDALPQRAS